MVVRIGLWKDVVAALSAGGATLKSDGSGGFVITTSSGKTFQFPVSGGYIISGADNFNLQYSGVVSVYGAIKTGGNGLSAILGNSPTPAAVTQGATPTYSPIGNGLTSSDSSHPSPPLGTSTPGKFTAVPFNTSTPLAAFTPQGFSGVMWFRVTFYISVTANTLSTAVTRFSVTTSADDQGTGPSTLTCGIINNATGVSGGSIPAGSTGYFQSVPILVPLTANQAGGSPTFYSTAIIQTQMVTAAGGTGSISGSVGVVIERVG
jgi:hypothetical protein